MDVNNETGIPTVFLRIATTPKIKNIKKAERNLLTVKPTFLVYFPGEQYFYADSSVPNENHCQVSVNLLKVKHFESYLKCLSILFKMFIQIVFYRSLMTYFGAKRL